MRASMNAVPVQRIARVAGLVLSLVVTWGSFAACSDDDGAPRDAAVGPDAQANDAESGDASVLHDASSDDAAVHSCVNIRAYTRGAPSSFELIPESTASEPGLGGCVVDEAYEATVCKVADVSELPSGEIDSVIRPVYSRWRNEDSAGQLYFLVKDGETPQWSGAGQLVIRRVADDGVQRIVSEVTSDESAEFRWDYSGARPGVLYYRVDCELREYDSATGQTALVHDFTQEFSNCGRILNDVEGDSSADSRFWAFMVQGPYDGNEFPMQAIVTYDLETDAILGTLDVARFQALGGTGNTLPRPNMVDISPLGTKVVALFGRTDSGDVFDGPHAYDLDFQGGAIKVCNDETHSGWAFAADGAEVYVCQVNGANWPNADADTIAYTDIVTGQTEVILYHEDLGWDVGGFHFGRFYDPAIIGWVFMSTYSEHGVSQSWMRNQLVMLELKPFAEHPRVWRIAETHNDYPGPDAYSREAYAPISGDGRRIYWGADWPGGDGTVDTYRVTLPTNWWETLGSYAVCP